MKPSALTPANFESVDESLLGQFESAWRDPQSPRLEAFVESHQVSTATLVELIRLDMEFCFRAGQRPNTKEYLRRFPGLENDSHGVAQIAFEEYRMRHSAGEPVSSADFAQGLGIDTSHWPVWSAPLDVSHSIAKRTDKSFVWTGTGVAAEFPGVPGRLLGFDLVGILGSGAFGRVYLARQDDLAKRFVALKVTSQPSAEPQHLAMLQHTNVVPIYSVHQQGQWQAICMPFLGVATLSDVFKHQTEHPEFNASGRAMISTVAAARASTLVSTASESDSRLVASTLSEATPTRFEAVGNWNKNETVAWMMRQLADGLIASHRQKIIHGDLKPANILISDDGQPLLLDFHLAQRRELHQESQVAGGTLPYMSPEHLAGLLEGGGIDERSDLYSLGAVFYQFLSGLTPYAIGNGDFDSMVAQLRRNQLSPPPALNRLRPDVDADLSEIIHKCLAGDLAQRYQTAAELREDLDRHLSHLPLKHARTRSQRQRLHKWIRRHPRASSGVTVGAVLGALLLGVTCLMLLRTHQANRLQADRDSREWVGELSAARIPLMVADGSLVTDDRAEKRLGELLDTELLSRRAANRNSLSSEQRAAETTSLTDSAFWLANYYLQQGLKAKTEPERKDFLDRAETANQLASSAGISNLSKAHLLQASRIATARRQPEEAARLDQAAANAPAESVADRFWLAAHLREAGSHQDLIAAIRLLREIVEQAPTDFAAWLLLGNVYAQAGRDPDALACYTVCMGLDHGDDRAVFNRGLTYLGIHDFVNAAEDFSEAIRRNPEDPASFANRALARRQLNQYDEAVDDVNQALDRGASQTRLLHLRSELHRALGKLELADSDLQTFLSQEPLDAESCWQRGMVFYSQGHMEKALDDLSHALELDPRCVEALQNKAHVYAESLNQPGEAIALMSRLVELQPTNPTALVTRGVLLARTGERDKALSDANRALDLSDSADTCYRAAGLFAMTGKEHSGDFDRAFQLLAQSIQKNPSVAARYMPIDPDLTPLHGDPRWGQLEEVLRLIKSLAEKR